MVFEPDHSVDVHSIPVDVNETTVIRLALPEPLEPTETLRQDRWFATETAVKSDGKSIPYAVALESPQTTVSAKLIVGVHRRGGITEPLSVTVNGEPIQVETGDASEFTEFFAPLDAPLPVSLLTEQNSVEVAAQPGTTITSVQIVTQRTPEEKSN